jgi:hypothetical protein
MRFGALGSRVVIGDDVSRVGQRIPEPGFRFHCEQDSNVNFNGWRCVSSRYFAKNGIPPGTVVTSENLDELMECCIDQFVRVEEPNPTKIMLVRTNVITRDSTGAVETEEVKDWMLVERRETEEFWHDCSLEGHDFELSIIDQNDKTLVGITVDHSGFR